MTPSDEARLARIAAFGLSRGENASEVEDRLLSYVRILTEEQLETAIERGRGILEIAQDITAGRYQRAALGIADVTITGLSRLHVYARYQLSGDEETSWRSISVRLPPGISVQDIPGAVARAIAAQNREGTDQGRALRENGTELIWVIPGL